MSQKRFDMNSLHGDATVRRYIDQLVSFPAACDLLGQNQTDASQMGTALKLQLVFHSAAHQHQRAVNWFQISGCGAFAARLGY